MKISHKQQNTIKIAEWFVPSSTTNSKSNNVAYGTSNVVESSDSISPEEAFLLKTDKGILVPKVTDKLKFIQLLVGHNRAAMQVKAWSEGFREGTLYLKDFEDEPTYIQDLALKAYSASFSERYDYVEQLGSWYHKLSYRGKVSYWQSLFRTDPNYRGLQGWNTIRQMLKTNPQAFKVIIDHETLDIKRIQYSSLVFFSSEK